MIDALRGSGAIRRDRLGSRRAGQAGVASEVSATVAVTSAIGATVALASVRSVAGGTGKTAVGRPAAAQTTW